MSDFINDPNGTALKTALECGFICVYFENADQEDQEGNND